MKYEQIISIGVEEEEEYFTKIKQKKLLNLHLKARVCHVHIIVKGWTGGLKISSRMTFDQPSIGRLSAKFIPNYIHMYR